MFLLYSFLSLVSALFHPSTINNVNAARFPANPQTRKPTLRLGTAQKASEVQYTLIIFSFSLINIKCCLSIIFVLLLLFQIYHFTVLLSLFHCTHLFRLGRVLTQSVLRINMPEHYFDFSVPSSVMEKVRPLLGDVSRMKVSLIPHCEEQESSKQRWGCHVGK